MSQKKSQDELTLPSEDKGKKGEQAEGKKKRETDFHRPFQGKKKKKKKKTSLPMIWVASSKKEEGTGVLPRRGIRVRKRKKSNF